MNPPEDARQDGLRLGPFELQKPLGKGANGVVWGATHRRTGVEVAVKVLTEARWSNAREVEAFRNEVANVSSLDHPHIVMVLDHGEATEAVARATDGSIPKGSPWLAMERATHTLRAQEQLPWSTIKTLLERVLRALAHAHARGLVHRDIKPENLLLGCHRGERSRDLVAGLRLADFGLALSSDTADSVAGTPAYMAPEQFSIHNIGPWTDLYALGCVAWELVCGVPPFVGDVRSVWNAHVQQAPPDLRPRIPIPWELEGWLRQLLAKVPEERPMWAADAIAELRRMLPADRPAVEVDARNVPEIHTTTLTVSAHARLPTSKTVPVSRWSSTPAPTTPSRAPAKVGRGTFDLDSLAFSGQTALSNRPARPARPVGRFWSGALPESWRVSSPHLPSVMLLDAGLGLLALRPEQAIGRSHERDELWRVLGEVAGGQTSLAVISAASGLGGGSLVRWLSTRAHEEGAAWVLSAEAQPNSVVSAIALGLSRLLGCAPHLDRRALETSCRQKLAALGSTADWLPEAIAAWVSGDGLVEAPGAVLGEVFQVLGRIRPVLAVLTDAQWVDDDRGALVYALQEAKLTGAPVLGVMVYREEEGSAPDFDVDIPRLDLQLAPLEPGELERSLSGLLPLGQELLSHIAERSQGNLGVARSLLIGLAEGGSLQTGTDGFHRRPGSVVSDPRDPWKARLIAAVGGSSIEMEALERLAALGMAVGRNRWSKVSGGWDPTDLAARMVRRGVLVPTPQGWALSHVLLRHALERHAREHGRWERHHEACATAGEWTDTTVDQLRKGSHWLSGGQAKRAIPPLLTAARAHIRQGMLRGVLRAIVLVEKAFSLAGVPEADSRRGEVELVAVAVCTLRSQSEAVERASALLERAELHGWPVLDRARVALGAALRSVGRVREARDCVEQVSAEADERVAHEAARTLARVYMLLGDLDKSEEIYEQMFSSEVRGTTLGRARDWHGLAMLALARGEVPRAEVYIARAMAETGDEELLLAGETQILRATLLGNQGEWDEAAKAWEEVLQLMTRMGSRAGQIDALIGLGDRRRALGRLDEAETHFIRATDLCRITGSPVELPTLNRALVKLERGAYADAFDLMEPLLDTAFTRQVAICRVVVGFILFQAAAGLGNWARVQELLSYLESQPSFSEGDIARCVAATAELAREAGHDEIAVRAEELGQRSVPP